MAPGIAIGLQMPDLGRDAQLFFLAVGVFDLENQRHDEAADVLEIDDVEVLPAAQGELLFFLKAGEELLVILLVALGYVERIVGVVEILELGDGVRQFGNDVPGELREL